MPSQEIYILQLSQVILYLCASVLFLRATMKRRELFNWFLVYLAITSGIIFNYLSFIYSNLEILSLITNVFYLITHLAIIVASFVEYNKYCRNDDILGRKSNFPMLLTLQLSFSLFFIILLEMLMIAIMVISIFLMLHVFFQRKTVLDSLILISQFTALAVIVNNLTIDLQLIYIENLSSSLAIFLGSILFIAGIVAPLEERIFISENKFRHLFEKSPFAIILLDSKGKIIDCNPATEKLVLFSKNDLVGKVFDELTIVQKKYIFNFRKMIQEVEIDSDPINLEIQINRSDGVKIWVNVQASKSLRNDKLFIEVIAHDITDSRKAESIIRKEFKKLRSLDNTRKELITRVTHELKTPLMSIRGASEFLQMVYDQKLSDEERSLIQMIEKGGKRLEYLINNLIDISRIEYKRLELKVNRYNFSEIVRDAVDEMRFNLKNRKIFLELDIKSEIILLIDNLRIRQIVTNLLSNAIKNTPPEGRIYVTLKKGSRWAVLKVKDTGVGLENHEIQKLFTRFGKIERFEQGLEYLDIQGSGLGLYICKNLVELHHGKISALSEGRGKGAEFTVKLPINNKKEKKLP